MQSISIQYATNQQRQHTVLSMQALYELSRKRDEEDGEKKKIKEEPTVPTSISNTVAHAGKFKPDAGLRKLRERGME